MKLTVTHRIEEGSTALQKTAVLECSDALLDFPTDATIQAVNNLLKQLPWVPEEDENSPHTLT